MRPVSKKYRKKDWKRSRRYENLKEHYGENWWDEYCGISFYNKKPYRTIGNKAVRRYPDMIPNGCAYKKIYDVQWEVW